MSEYTTNEFLWPSDLERAENENLNRVCEHLEEVLDERDKLQQKLDTLVPKEDWQTKARGTNDEEYQIYLSCADNGNGGDITRNGAPLLSYDEWISS